MEFPIPAGITDLDWWDRVTTRQTQDYCPDCEPDTDNRMLDIKRCPHHQLLMTQDMETVERITVPFVDIVLT